MNSYNPVRAALSISLLVAASALSAGETSRINVSSSGEQANSYSIYNVISGDGRFVVFSSEASNLVPNDTNGVGDVFLHDRLNGQISRVSVSSSGEQANDSSSLNMPAISADGRFVAFQSYASNLVLNDTNDASDIFVWDRLSGQTSRVSVSSSGEQGNYFSSISSINAISADGRFVVFESGASNLVPNDTNGAGDVFVRDRLSGQTSRVSVSSSGVQSNNRSYNPAISADGSFVAFNSEASNLVSNDTNGQSDAFVRNRLSGQTSRVSVSSSGEQANDHSSASAISADGRFVVFWSGASNLVPNDANIVDDVFVRDRLSGQTSLVSVSSNGAQGNNGSLLSAVSADGRFVAFQSNAGNLVPNDTNGRSDIFLRDLWYSQTVRVSVSSSEVQSNHDSFLSSISADGRFVSFLSNANNLVPNDINGQSDIFVRHRLDNTSSSAKLTVAVTTKPASIPKGTIASYTITIANAGPDIARAVTLIDVIAQGTVSSVVPSQGTCSKAAVSVCHFGPISPGGSVTVTAKIRADRDPLKQRFSVNARTLDPVLGNNYAAVNTPVTP